MGRRGSWSCACVECFSLPDFWAGIFLLAKRFILCRTISACLFSLLTCSLSLIYTKNEKNYNYIRLTNLRTLDLSKNLLRQLDVRCGSLVNLKSLNLDHNKLTGGTVSCLSKLTKLQNLSLGGNLLGRMIPGSSNTNPNTILPTLPSSLKQFKLNDNFLSSIPPSIITSQLTKLEKLDLSSNQLAAIPVEIATTLQALIELNLDSNSIVSLPNEMGQLRQLKQLSLRNNHITVTSTIFSESNPQPLPSSLFTDTPMIDLNLHGNPMTSTQLNHMNGYDVFLKRRQEIKTNALLGGALTNLDVCGLE